MVGSTPGWAQQLQHRQLSGRPSVILETNSSDPSMDRATCNPWHPPQQQYVQQQVIDGQHPAQQVSSLQHWVQHSAGSYETPVFAAMLVAAFPKMTPPYTPAMIPTISPTAARILMMISPVPSGVFWSFGQQAPNTTITNPKETIVHTTLDHSAAACSRSEMVAMCKSARRHGSQHPL